MRLFYSPTSPFARKVRMVLREKGLEGCAEEVACDPFQDPSALQAASPLGKVPTLATEEVGALYDSAVIAAYLESLTPEPRLIPLGAARWPVLAREALADGAMEAAFATVMERRRPEAERSAMWLERWEAAIVRSLNAVEADRGAWSGPLSVAHIGLGAALGYLDFRLPDLDWRLGRPQTADWFAQFAARPSMISTAPPG